MGRGEQQISEGFTHEHANSMIGYVTLEDRFSESGLLLPCH